MPNFDLLIKSKRNWCYKYTMLVNFLGAPCSGKTTIAAMVFAMLKEQGISCEFIPEQARWHIARKRNGLYLSPTENLILTNQDQFLIMDNQYEIEETLLTAVKDTAIVISDSSTLLSLLYMTPVMIGDPWIQDLMQKSIKRDCLYFYVSPIPASGNLDPNRLHSREQSIALDLKLDLVLKEQVPQIYDKIIRLQESSATRTRVAVSAILQKMFRNANSYSTDNS